VYRGDDALVAAIADLAKAAKSFRDKRGGDGDDADPDDEWPSAGPKGIVTPVRDGAGAQAGSTTPVHAV